MPNVSSNNHKHDRPWLIKQLWASEELGPAELADILDTCTADHPCRSAACPDCSSDFRQAEINLINHFIREPARDDCRDRMTAHTIIPAAGCLGPDDLTVEACHRVGNEITTALATVGLPPTIMHLDFSYNEDTTGEVEEHWCAHTHGAQVDWLPSAQKAALRVAVSRLLQKSVAAWLWR